MTATLNTNEQVYNLHEDESLSSQVAQVICILLQRGMLTAGFTADKELLMLHYSGYNNHKPVWELDFFEHIFLQEPLLAAKEKVKGVFVLSDKNLVIPNDLYDENEAGNWLGHVHFIEPNDVILSYSLDDDNAQYLFAVPLSITELVKINFKKAALLPFPVYCFKNTNKQGLYLQCCITGEQLCATLHNYSQLLWHRIFEYSSAEDIAFSINQLCIENHISSSDVSFNCNATSAAEYDTLNELSQYFPTIKNGSGATIHTRWDGAICLAQQLLACV